MPRSLVKNVDDTQFIVGMMNSAPSLMPAARPQPRSGEDAQAKSPSGSVHRRDDELRAVLDAPPRARSRTAARTRKRKTVGLSSSSG